MTTKAEILAKIKEMQAQVDATHYCTILDELGEPE